MFYKSPLHSRSSTFPGEPSDYATLPPMDLLGGGGLHMVSRDLSNLVVIHADQVSDVIVAGVVTS